jgi:hypothetical protein
MDPEEPVGELIPRPDPTKLTAEALKSLNEAFTRELARMEKQFNKAIDNLLEYHRLDLQRMEEVLTEKQSIGMGLVHNIKEVYDQKLAAVALQFDLVERQRIEIRQNNATALDAALTSMKESHAALGNTYTSSHTALVSLVDDIKGRVTALEAMRMGSKETNTGMYAALGIILTIVWIAITVLALYHR